VSASVFQNGCPIVMFGTDMVMPAAKTATEPRPPREPAARGTHANCLTHKARGLARQPAREPGGRRPFAGTEV
jgi:hypothetical protein